MIHASIHRSCFASISFALFLFSLPLASAPAALAEAQITTGRGRACGQVLDADGAPLAGASVSLRLGEREGPPAVVTDAEGRWALLGLAAGRWRLGVEAQGWITAEGTVDVAEEGPCRSVRLVMRPLSEATPGGAEVPHTIYSWLEKGNALLAQGHPAEARAEYEKALRTLPRAERPEVLRAIARTWYLEGDREKAVAAVEQGLEIAPTDKTLKELLRLLLDELGRAAEYESRLASVAERARTARADEDEASGAQDLPPAFAAWRAAPAEAPRAGRTGRYKAAFTERSPWSALPEVVRRGNLEEKKILAESPKSLAYDIHQESFEVIVPEGEPPAAGWGLVVWVSPWEFGGLAKVAGPALEKILNERKLIWVGANQSGNERLRVDRWGLAVDAAYHLQKLYRIDPNRIYAAGHSGGGRAASVLALTYPDLFRGALMFMGVDWYRDLPVADRPGAHWPAPFGKPPHELLRLARERSRLVLITGETDFNRAETRVVEKEMRRDDFQHVTYLEVPAMPHGGPVPAEWLEKAFAAVEPAYPSKE